MTESTNASVVPFIPTFAPVKLNGRQNDLLPYDVYFDYTEFALRHFRYDFNEGKNAKRYFVHVEVLESDSPRLKPGQDTCLHFPVGRSGTATDPKRPERDAEQLGKLVCAMLGLSEATPQELAAACAAFEAQGRIKDNSVRFGMARKPGKTVEVTKKDKTGKLERDANGQIVTEERTFANDYYMQARVSEES